MKQLLLTAMLALALLFVSESAHAQSANLAFGAHGAYDLDAESFGIGGQVRAGIGLGGYALVLNPSIDYYFVDDAEALGTEINSSLFRLNADLLYQIGAANVQVFQPYVGAGLGISRGTVEVETAGEEESASETDLGLNLIAGANFGIGASVVPFAQAVILIGDGSAVGIKAGILFGGP